jgi:hypothetical protein
VGPVRPNVEVYSEIQTMPNMGWVDERKPFLTTYHRCFLFPLFDANIYSVVNNKTFEVLFPRLLTSSPIIPIMEKLERDDMCHKAMTYLYWFMAAALFGTSEMRPKVLLF